MAHNENEQKKCWMLNETNEEKAFFQEITH